MGDASRHDPFEAIIGLRSTHLHSGMYVLRLEFIHKVCHIEVTTSAGIGMFYCVG